jgi:tetratricopeptide (TPR) repeat protein
MMKVFLFSATAPDGRKVHERIEAAGLDQARYTLEIRRYHDIEFLTDENAADIQRSATAGTGVPEADPEVWTAEAEAESHRRPGVAVKIWWAFKQRSLIFGVLALANILSWRGGPPFGWLDWLGFAATPLYALVFVKLVTPMILFQLILEAAVWHDWNKLRRLIGVARRLRKVTVTGIPELELDIREATALAAGGRLDEGLALMERHRGRAELAEYLFLSRLSGLYDVAGQYDRALALMEESAAKGPGGVSEWIDVAMVRIRRMHDAAGARAALARLEDKEVPALAQAVRLIVEGLILVEERDHERAVEYFRAGLEKLQVAAGNPLGLALFAEARAGTVIALARLGRKDAARKILAGERPLLEARQEKDLLARCDAALAG